MSIVKMKRVKALGMTDDRQELLKELRSLGCVEIRTPTDIPEDWTFLAPPLPRDLDRVNTQTQELEGALQVLNRDGKKKKKGLLSARPVVEAETLFAEETYQSALRTAREINEDQRKLIAHQAQRAKLVARMASLEPWLELPVPLDFSGTRRTNAWFVSMPRGQSRAGVTDKLDAVTELYDLTWCGEDKESKYFFLLCHDSAAEEVQSALLDAGCTRLSLKNWSGTAGENHAALQKELAELDDFIAGRQADIEENRGDQETLELALERARQDAELERAKLRSLDSESTFLLEGWLPAEKETEVTAALEAHGMAYELAEPTQDEYPQVPIQLKSNPVTDPFTVITEMYSMPAYDGVDPNPLMAPFFILFFGCMMNDIAYGLLMALGTAFYKWKARPKGNMGRMMSLFFLCGISSIGWGCITGSFFGDFIPRLFTLANPELLGLLKAPLTGGDPTWFWAPVFSPVNDTIMVMIGAMALGVLQVFTGMAISAIEKFRKGDPLDAIFDEIAWWVLIGGGAWAILGGGTAGLIVLAIGFLMLVGGGTRKSKGFGKAASAVGILYNGISGFFSDILSYLRLMALMMAGAIIAQVFNTLGSVLGLVPFIIIALIGNALNLVLNLLGCYVHTLRLQCLEFFGRFYKDGGKAFQPLKVNTKSVDII